eukprot:TRINITY_DN74712_c0_g1_i1.p1 TRINITY_DN74712_c0_g1~~TRINITY_DN74712_c0_g1_i1.p1  ORF type:complete len:603 (-),score=119.10 TRINITY_DN74712_c0_g1_i1:68-1876(-)
MAKAATILAGVVIGFSYIPTCLAERSIDYSVDDTSQVLEEARMLARTDYDLIDTPSLAEELSRESSNRERSLHRHRRSRGNTNEPCDMPSAMQVQKESGSELAVGVVTIAPYGVLNDTAWQDSFAILAHSARKVMGASRRATKVDYICLVPDEVAPTDAAKEKERDALKTIGFDARFVSIPVHLSEVKNPSARSALSKVLGEREELKYYGAAFTEFDRVLLVDGDVVLLQPFDELFDLSASPGMVGTYDHEMDLASSTFPPVNSGFLLFTPNKGDFDGLVEVYREGNLSDSGFRRSGTGWTYGAGSQGMLSFFYNQWIPGSPGFNTSLKPIKGKDLPGEAATLQPPGSRFFPVDRSVHGVIQTESLLKSFKEGRATVDRVKSFHFAGGCMKPWTCSPRHEVLCKTMTDKWWELRRELEVARGMTPKERCGDWGHYEPMNILEIGEAKNEEEPPAPQLTAVAEDLAAPATPPVVVRSPTSSPVAEEITAVASEDSDPLKNEAVEADGENIAGSSQASSGGPSLTKKNTVPENSLASRWEVLKTTEHHQDAMTDITKSKSGHWGRSAAGKMLLEDLQKSRSGELRTYEYGGDGMEEVVSDYIEY